MDTKLSIGDQRNARFLRIFAAIVFLIASVHLAIPRAEATTYFIHPDHLGTPQVITDSTQAVVWRATYDAFGKATVTVASVENNLRFPGQYYDAESGLHYNYFRDYDPEIGRYLQSDPIGLDGGLNTYAYANNNPVRFIDRLGLQSGAIAPAGPLPIFLPPKIEGVGDPVSEGLARLLGKGIQNIGLGITLGNAIVSSVLCEQSEADRCAEILKECRRRCLDIFVEDPASLPGQGPDKQGRQRRCIRECMEANNCFNF